MAGEGCVYRRCGCVDPVTGRQFGRVCPRLAGGRHGSWYVRLELPAGLDGHRRRIRRGGYPSRKAAAAVLARLRTPHPGDASGSMLTVGDWLAHWLVSRTSPAASTVRGYTAHVRLYLAPYLGQVLLAELSAAQVQAMFTAITRQHQELGSPVTAATLNRIRATLRAALNAAIRRGLITGNPASRAELPRARRPRAVVWTPGRVEHCQRTGERPAVAVWTAAQTTQFLRAIAGYLDLRELFSWAAHPQDQHDRARGKIRAKTGWLTRAGSVLTISAPGWSVAARRLAARPAAAAGGRRRRSGAHAAASIRLP